MDDPNRWAALEQVFYRALALDPAERDEYLRTACGEDEDLRRRVQSMLAHDEASPPADAATPAGRHAGRIGPYQILAMLGAGGMGEVYLALDTRLGRQVALKLLPPRFLADAERKRRLLGEARAASALNHPNIVSIHDVGSDRGIDYIVMEFIAGRPLSRLIPNNGLKLKEALHYALQIAGALECAHAAGVIHRDLKPANVMITDAGVAKVLDFGLAKVTSGLNATQTLERQSSAGVIAGTLGYMSPEQAEGRPVDARTDVFSFGALLYEMVTGRRAFQRDSVAATLAAILHDHPEPADRVADETPAALASLIQRCLQKDPADRVRDAGELKTVLSALDDAPPAPRMGAAKPALNRAKWMVPLAAAGLVLIAVAVLFWSRLGSAGSSDRAFREDTALTPVPLTSYPGDEDTPAFSPDGNQVAFIWSRPGTQGANLYIKLLGENEPVALTKGIATDASPAWSPDGRWIAFLRQSSRPVANSGGTVHDRATIVLLPAIGGPERIVAQVYCPLMLERHISWHPNGKWLAVMDRASESEPESVFLVSTQTGEKRRLTFPPRNSDGDLDPAVSPDGRSIAFVRTSREMVGYVHLLNITPDLHASGEPVRLTSKHQYTSYPVWSSDGQSIVYSSGSPHNPSLWRLRVPRSPGRLETPERLAFAGQGPRSPAISKHRLAYSQHISDSDIYRLELRDVHGVPSAPKPATKLIASTRLDHTPSYSPDGTRIAFASDRSGNYEIWTCARDGSDTVQLTSLNGPYAASPFWSPDGQSIAFEATLDGHFAVYVIPARGGVPKRLTDPELEAGAGGWSSDGKWVYFFRNRPGESLIGKVPAVSGAPVEITRKAGGLVFESPDGRYLYCMSTDKPVASLYRLPIGGGEPVELIPAVYGRNFVIARRGIYFIASPENPAIQFLNLATARVTMVARLRQTPAYGFALSPDGRELLYTEFNESNRDLMLVENFE